MDGATTSGHILNVMSNEQPFTSDIVNIQYEYDDGNNTIGILPNKDIKLGTKINTTQDSGIAISCIFSDPVGTKISPVMDLDRFSMVLAERQSSPNGTIDGSILGETQIDSSTSNTRTRYISKIVTIENGIANNIAVFLKIAARNSDVLVFVKRDDLLDRFDDNNWVQLKIDTNNDNYGDNADVDNDSFSSNFTFRPEASTPLGNFSRYSIKIIVCMNDSESENNIPTIRDLRAVPILN